MRKIQVPIGGYRKHVDDYEDAILLDPGEVVAPACRVVPEGFRVVECPGGSCRGGRLLREHSPYAGDECGNCNGTGWIVARE